MTLAGPFPEQVSDMELNEKLQELRKKKGLTQEELAELLYVSRAAVSKWESGRGYPSIDSLKALAAFFSVTIDELLSGDEVLTIAEEDQKQNKKQFCDLLFGLLDCSSAIFCFLPFFGQKAKEGIQAVSLLSLAGIEPYLKLAYFVVVIGMVGMGILSLALHHWEHEVWNGSKNKLSLSFNVMGALLFIISSQPYAATLLFLFLIIKGVILLKQH